MKNEFDYLNDVKMDFSCYGEEIISEKELRIMGQSIKGKKKKISTKKIFVIAACIAVFTITTAFASGFVDNIVKRITTGYNSFLQIDPNAPHELPDELKGKIFDENGNKLEAITKSDFENIYDENGEKISNEKLSQMYIEALGESGVKISNDYDADTSEKNYSSIDEAQQIAEFDLKVPEYLPDGYSFERAYSYKDEEENVSGWYMNIVYKNEDGKEIIIFERLLNEETAFESSTDGKIEEIELNGRLAVISDDRNLDFETEDNVSVGISSKGNISREELIKMAESVR